MSAHEDGGPAFPQVETRYEGERGEYTQYVESAGGMSLRDYFAAKAVQAMVAENDRRGSEFGFMSAWEIAQRAYAQADAMLKARKS